MTKRATPKVSSTVGAHVLPKGGVRFGVWAPKRQRVEVVLENGPTVALQPEAEGYFAGVVAEAAAGSLYRYRLDGGESYPDPASRFQPEGVYGPSEVIDPSSYRWQDPAWKGRTIRGQVIYEMHVGTFTPEGTYEAAAKHLPALVDLGVTVLEIMPVNEFFGRFGWGYDGVDWYAPTRLYGRPDDLRRFVDAAHRLGLAVILDVVYNHFGSEGAYWREFADDYFQSSANEWGDAINFDGPNNGPVREFVLENAAYWIRDFHLDGLRIDATQALIDTSPEPITQAIARVAREAAGGRSTILIGENEPQRAELIRPGPSGVAPLDALWNDDFHHVAKVASTGRREGYLGDYHGTAREFVAAVKHGFLYQGQFNHREGKRRGSWTRGVPREAFVLFLQNHDQVANSHRGDRCHMQMSPGLYRALTALMLLTPGTPMLFQGQEFAASSPFLYFADHEPALREPTQQGRNDFLSQFPSLALKPTMATIADPSDPATFERSKLNHQERETHAQPYALHRDLLHLRRDDPTLALCGEHGLDAAQLSEESFVVRLFGADSPEDDRLLLVNLGVDRLFLPPTEPLLAPLEGKSWSIRWTSEDVAYGGSGTPDPETREGWQIQGRATVLLEMRGEVDIPPGPLELGARKEQKKGAGDGES